jgi:hypothetical protein
MTKPENHRTVWVATDPEQEKVTKLKGIEVANVNNLVEIRTQSEEMSVTVELTREQAIQLASILIRATGEGDK